PDVGPSPPVEDLGPVSGKLRIDFGHEALAPLEQDEPDFVAIDVLVHGSDPVRERGQLAEQFHTDQPAADDREGELSTLAVGVRLDVGALEPLNDMVAE